MRIKLIIPLLLIMLALFSTFSYADVISSEVITNKVFDNPNFYTSSDYQYITVYNPVYITNLKVIGKADPQYATVQPVLIFEDSTNTTVFSSLSLDQINDVYFTDINFKADNVLLEAGVYRFQLNTIGGFNYFYSDTSTQDTYEDGGINSINSTNDVYFVISGYYSESAFNNEDNENLLTEILGDTPFFLLLASIGILIGVSVLVAQKVKVEFFIMLVVIIATVLLWLLGILNFYVAGFIIVSDVISYTYGAKNE